jgi:hypothetical protein
VALVSLFGHELVPDFARFLMSLDPQWGHFIFCLFWFLKPSPKASLQNSIGIRSLNQLS